MFEVIKNFFLSFSKVQGNKRKILIIESRQENTQFLNRILSHKYIILTAQDKKESLKKARSLRPDLIILNSKLFKESTLDLCISLRSFVETSNIPILMVAKKNDTSNVAEFYAKRVEGYLIEPFSKQDIQVQVQLALNSRNGE